MSLTLKKSLRLKWWVTRRAQTGFETIRQSSTPFQHTGSHLVTDSGFNLYAVVPNFQFVNQNLSLPSVPACCRCVASLKIQDITSNTIRASYMVSSKSRRLQPRLDHGGLKVGRL